jgi:hypothetical protein
MTTPASPASAHPGPCEHRNVLGWSGVVHSRSALAALRTRSPRSPQIKGAQVVALQVCARRRELGHRRRHIHHGELVVGGEDRHRAARPLVQLTTGGRDPGPVRIAGKRQHWPLAIPPRAASSPTQLPASCPRPRPDGAPTSTTPFTPSPPDDTPVQGLLQPAEPFSQLPANRQPAGPAHLSAQTTPRAPDVGASPAALPSNSRPPACAPPRRPPGAAGQRVRRRAAGPVGLSGAGAAPRRARRWAGTGGRAGPGSGGAGRRKGRSARSPRSAASKHGR